MDLKERFRKEIEEIESLLSGHRRPAKKKSTDNSQKSSEAFIPEKNKTQRKDSADLSEGHD